MNLKINLLFLLFSVNHFIKAKRLLLPRTASRFYAMIEPVDINLEPKLSVALIYNLTKEQRNSPQALHFKAAQNVFKEAAKASDYLDFIIVNASHDKTRSLNCDFNLSVNCPNIYLFKNGKFVSNFDNGCNWNFTPGEILNYAKKFWSSEIDCIRQERTERYNTLQELSAESMYYDLPWSWGGPFYRGYNGWNGFYGYNPYDIWPFSGSMLGN
jgi:hypothetical protein